MFLKSLELTGFKSFAKRTVLPFEESLTAIVGPNGSGKSNVADAIRWVLGAQSKKAVRGKIGTDVIFSGSGTKKQMGLAEVSLTFDNTDQRFPYDFPEVVVTRRLYRSGDSEYLLNGRKVRLADLLHAMAVAGVGAEHYTVINQGMVDQVLSQTPIQRRAVFEEAAGVRQFYLRRDEARRKLTETTTNLSRVEDIIRELAPRLKLLKRQASILGKQKEIEARLRDAYRAKFGYRYRDLAEERRVIKQKQDDLNKEFIAIDQELTALNKETTDLRRRQQGSQLNDLLSAKTALQSQKEKIQQSLTQALTAQEVAKVSLTQQEQQKGGLAERLKLIAAETSKSPGTVADESTELKKVKAEVAELEKQYQEAQKGLSPDEPGRDLSELQQSLNDLARAVSKKTPYQDLAKRIEKITAIVKNLDIKPNLSSEDILTEVQEILKKRDEAIKRLDQLLRDHIRGEEIAKYSQDYRQKLSVEAKSIQGQTSVLEGQIAENRLAVADLHGQATNLSKQITEITTKLAALENQIVQEHRKPDSLSELSDKEQALETKRQTYESYRDSLSELNLDLAKVETRLADLADEAKGKLSQAFPPTDAEELPSAEQGQPEQIAKIERQMLELGGIDPIVTKEFEEVDSRYTFLSTQAEDLRKAKADLEKVIKQLERKSQVLFREAFVKINEEFGYFFTKLFGGGKAELYLIENEVQEDSEEVGEVGIDIKATPPGKRVQSLSMLSGGERALSSVALLFAILKVNPSPFVMLDEVDAALDEANTSRFADLLSDLYERTQFIVVTHNRDTMKKAKMLYGVTMDDTGMSTLLSIKLSEAETVAAKQLDV